MDKCLDLRTEVKCTQKMWPEAKTHIGLDGFLAQKTH